jgi:hypothetical protein
MPGPMSGESAFGAVSLAEAIGELRRELTASVASGQDQEIGFEVGEVLVELSLAMEREVGGKGGVKFWVVNAEGSARTGRAVTHRLTVPLTPRRKTGGPVVTGRD